MSQVKWLPKALEDVERLHAFLKRKNPVAAARAAKTILSGAELLANVPEAGRPMPDTTRRREFFMPFGSGTYVIRYMLENDHEVVIIRVWHSRENRTE